MIQLKQSIGRLSSLDALASATLIVIAWLIAGFLVRDDLFIYGDHPGHYWVMWYTLNVSAPLHHRLIDWIPYWYAGYPELQFTPPGYVFLGWLVNLLSLGKLSTELVYETVAFIAFALPALTFYYAVHHLGFDRRAAYLAGVFGLVFPAFFDGATALFIGMIGSRLAWALDALILVWVVDWLEGRGVRYGLLSASTLAIAILAHPYHEIGMMLALGLYVVIRHINRPSFSRHLVRAGVSLLAIVAFAAAVDAFWLLPLLAHSSDAMIPLVRSTTDQLWHLLVDSSLVPYALPALFALVRFQREQDATRRAVLMVLLILPLSLGAAMLFIHIILIDQWHVYTLDPVRLIGEYYFALLLLAAIGAAEIVKWFSSAIGGRPVRSCIIASAAIVLIVILFLIPLLQAVDYYRPKQNEEPRFLSQAMESYKLEELWQVLRETAGRVFFTSAETQLTSFGGEPFPTTLAALTPLFTGRPLMGGTYSHWSPVAAMVWVGNPHPPALWGLVQDEDDRTLFGVSLERITVEDLVRYCREFNITTLVASRDDYRTRTFLDSAAGLQSYYNNGFFFVYRIKDTESAALEAQNARVDVLKSEDDQIELRVRAAQADASVQVKIYAYALWRAYTGDGQRLDLKADNAALMQIALPRGEDYRVIVRYEPGSVERLGDWISALSGLVWVGLLLKGKVSVDRLRRKIKG